MAMSRLVVSLALCCGLMGCEGGFVGGSAPVASAESIATTITDLRIQPGEKLRVTVFGEDKLSGDYDVDPSGSVSLPLAGTVKASGLTKAALELELAKRFRSEYLRNPKVTVDISAFRPFYILGEVGQPGEHPYKSGLNVMTAIAVSGGNTYRSSNTRVLIQRSGEITMKEYPMSSAVPIYPGDLIKVPERYF
jgi:protein involved in polysaccharide export with SLBB domain